MLADTTGADGPLRDRRHHRGHLRQARGAPGRGGYDPVDVPDVVVRGETTVTKDVTLDRNWASKAGGASVAFVNDDTRRRRRLRPGRS